MKNTFSNSSANSLNIRFSDLFTLSEMTCSGVALRHELKNIPTDVELENLRHLCELVLEPLRRRYGRIIILSGYLPQPSTPLSVEFQIPSTSVEKPPTFSLAP